MCGGTSTDAVFVMALDGLSPRVRGNPVALEETHMPDRSIPACAGEPYHSGGRLSIGKVYPRVCGGTWPSICSAAAAAGLSPRVRGNQDFERLLPPNLRSIPACAGEP